MHNVREKSCTMLLRVVLIIGILNVISTLNVPSTSNTKQLDVTNTTEETVSESDPINKRNAINDVVKSMQNENKEEMAVAEDSNLVYRPLFVYRRIHHSKKRITMFNSFAG